MEWKPREWILIGMVWAMLATAVLAQATTEISDTVDHADGTVASGTVLISWPSFVTGFGDTIPSGSVSTTITAGVLDVHLVPNSGSTPMGSYYTVVFQMDDGTVSREYWVVPVSTGSVRLSAISTTVLPADGGDADGEPELCGHGDRGRGVGASAGFDALCAEGRGHDDGAAGAAGGSGFSRCRRRIRIMWIRRWGPLVAA